MARYNEGLDRSFYVSEAFRQERLLIEEKNKLKEAEAEWDVLSAKYSTLFPNAFAWMTVQFGGGTPEQKQYAKQYNLVRSVKAQSEMSIQHIKDLIKQLRILIDKTPAAPRPSPYNPQPDPVEPPPPPPIEPVPEPEPTEPAGPEQPTVDRETATVESLTDKQKAARKSWYRYLKSEYYWTFPDWERAWNSGKDQKSIRSDIMLWMSYWDDEWFLSYSVDRMFDKVWP